MSTRCSSRPGARACWSTTSGSASATPTAWPRPRPTNPADAVVAEIVAAGGEAVVEPRQRRHPRRRSGHRRRRVRRVRRRRRRGQQRGAGPHGAVRGAHRSPARRGDRHAASGCAQREPSGVGGDGRAGWRPLRERVVRRRLRRRARRCGVRHGQDGRDRSHAGDGVRRQRRRDRGQRDRAVREDSSRAPASGRSRPAQSSTSGCIHGSSRRSSGGSRTRRAR